jgi:membrane protease YdiL (CAAX protease family)
MTEGNPDRTKLSVIVFLLLTFGLSSIFYWRIIHQAAPGMQRGHNFDVLYLMWSPGVSGLLTRLIFQGNWRGHGFGWGRTKYQLASIGIPVAYASAVYLPVWFAGYFDGGNSILKRLSGHLPWLPQWSMLAVFFAIIATAGLLSSCVSALGEELGWRGFLVPQLAKFMPYPAVGLISGIVWALWHYPIILFSYYRGAGPLWYSLLCFTVMVIGSAFLFAWMRLKSGSVWTGMFLHASHNVFIQAFFDTQTRHSRFTDLWTTEFGAGLAIMGIAIAAICYSKRGELPAIPAS